MNILITGGAGFIGSHTADRLAAMGHRIRILDNLQQPIHLKGKPTYLSSEYEFVLGDVRDKETLRKALKNIDIVFHLAAYQDYLTDFSTFFHVNAVSTALIYEIILEDKLDIQKVIVASSQFVQGEGIYKNKNGKIISPTIRSDSQLQKGVWDWQDENGEKLEWLWCNETHANPPNAYAMSKYSQEQQALRFGSRYNIPSVALRYSIVQGSRQSFYNAYSGACRIFSLHYFFDKAPTIYEDGLQLRDFVNIHDVVDANVLVMQNDEANYQAFCVGGGQAHTLIDFCKVVAKEFNKENITPLIPGEYRFGDTRVACSDITKLNNLGWAPSRTTTDSVNEYIRYLEQQTDIDDILEFAEKTMKKMNVVRKANPK